MYFDYKGWTGGSDTLGASVLGRCFYFAEGTTRPGFDEWATVFSPSDGAMASVVLLYPDGTKDGPISYLVGPTHRTTIDINKAAVRLSINRNEAGAGGRLEQKTCTA